MGDCNGRGAFTHTAYNDFEIIAANLLDDDDRVDFLADAVLRTCWRLVLLIFEFDQEIGVCEIG